MSTNRWNRLSAWHNAWLAADPEERVRLGAQLEAEQPELTEEANEIVANSAVLPAFLETPAFVLTAQDLASAETPLPAGAMVGPYRIVNLVARGGMGDVYRATDIRLHRDVAVKMLARAALGHPEQVDRFLQEARVTASLDHPHIVRIYDVGLEAGQPYLVAELLDGETLRSRLARERLSVGDAIRIAADVGRGLVAAHAVGLVHRDMKPENIFITRSGPSKILDFGVAKLTHDDPRRDAVSTLPGVVFGTAGYLAPEQIQGAVVDGRADLFALGSMLFEMLTGQRAFGHDHTIDTLHAILHDPVPDVLQQRDDVPSALAVIVKRLLEKSPDARFQSAADLVWALEQVAVTPTPSSNQNHLRSADSNVRRRLETLARVAIIGLATTGIVGGSLWTLRQARSPAAAIPLTQFTWTLPAALELDSAPVVSPDSQAIAFVGRDGSGRRLFVRSLAALEAVVIRGTEGAKQPFWSPDGRWIGYFSTGKLWKVASAGGSPPVEISDAPDARGGTWSRSGTIVFAPRVIGSGLLSVSEDGGKAEPATLLDESKGENAHWWPSFLPDGVHYLYFVRASADARRGVYIGSTDRPAERSRSLLFESESEAIYAPLDNAGILLSVADGEIQARPFHPKDLTITGAARNIGVPAGAKTPYHSAMLGASSDLLTHVRSAIPYGGQLIAVMRNGIEERRWPELEVQNWIRVSPDGHRLALTRVDGARGRVGLWIEDLERRVLTPVTTSAAAGVFPVWSPDGTRLAYGANRIEKPDLVIASTDGSELHATLSCPGLRCELTDWSRDGRLVFNVAEGATRDVWTIEAKAGGAAQRLLAEPYIERDARVSPDSGWIAYVSEQTGRPEVVVQSLVGRRQRIPVSGSGGEQPVWRRDGAELFFVQPQTGALNSVSVRHDGATLRLSAAVTHSVPAISRHQGTDYDISPDGSRVYLVDRHPRPRPREVGIILGWRALLR